MKNIFKIVGALLIFIFCSAFERYTPTTNSPSLSIVAKEYIEQTYYVNSLGNRVETINSRLHGCYYLVKETQGGRTCQKINF